jgi:enterochelin esterase-like enzyme
VTLAKLAEQMAGAISSARAEYSPHAGYTPQPQGEHMVSSVWIEFLAIGIAIALVALVWPAHAGEAAGKQETAKGWVMPAVRAPRLEQRVFYSTAANAMVSYHVFAPDTYGSDKDRDFPVIYWLHGFKGGGVKQLPQLAEHFDRAIREGKLLPALVVFPNGITESMWVNTKDGQVPMETVVIRDLIANVDGTYRTIASRSGRLIEGFSMGGYGAARLGFKYPEIFGSVSILGAGPMQREFKPGADKMTLARSRILEHVYGNDQAYFLAQSPWVLAERYADGTRDKLRVRIAVGSEDAMLSSNEDFADHLSRLRIPHDFRIVPNVGHAPLPLFRGLGEANWDFYREALGETVSSESTGVTAPSKRRSTMQESESSVPENERRRGVVERLRRFDYDKDGVIDLRDMPPPVKERFQHLDKDADGRLDREELSNLR